MSTSRDRIEVKHLISITKTELEKNTEQCLPGDAYQSLLARLLPLLPELEKIDDESLLGMADLALTLILKRNNQDTIESVVSDLELRTNIYKHPIKNIKDGGLPVSIKVTLGVIVFIVISYLFVSVYLNLIVSLANFVYEVSKISPNDFINQANMLVAVGATGAFGSIASIMTRIQDIGEIKGKDPFASYFVGLFKPFIGVSMSIGVYLFLRAEILPISVKPQVEFFFFIALSFLCGFSERWARDMIAKAEQSFIGKTKSEKHAM